jgi:quercetin dioxygenase-like cupin family protein
MYGTGFFETLEKGVMILENKELKVSETPWSAHPAFTGVWLKHLLKGEDSGGLLSCHLVRVDPGCQIGDHLHQGQYELHEVVQGQGVCHFLGRELDYHAGVSALMPPDVSHSIVAGDQGLWIMAKFLPALL